MSDLLRLTIEGFAYAIGVTFTVAVLIWLAAFAVTGVTQFRIAVRTYRINRRRAP